MSDPKPTQGGLEACVNCGAWWPPEGILEIELRRGSGETITLCFPCVEHAIRCDHSQENPKRCVVCWEIWAEADTRRP